MQMTYQSVLFYNLIPQLNNEKVSIYIVRCGSTHKIYLRLNTFFIQHISYITQKHDKLKVKRFLDRQILQKKILTALATNTIANPPPTSSRRAGTYL